MHSTCTFRITHTYWTRKWNIVKWSSQLVTLVPIGCNRVRRHARGRTIVNHVKRKPTKERMNTDSCNRSQYRQLQCIVQLPVSNSSRFQVYHVFDLISWHSIYWIRHCLFKQSIFWITHRLLWVRYILDKTLPSLQNKALSVLNQVYSG